MSSCANHILGGAARRIVLPDAILGFHGGVPVITRAESVAALKQAGSHDIAVKADRVVARNANDREEQRVFLAQSGLSGDFFAWMARYKHAVRPTPAYTLRPGRCRLWCSIR